EQQITYFNSLDESKQGSLSYDNQIVQQLLQQVNGMEQYFKNPQPILSTETGANPVIKNTPIHRDTQVHDKTQ
ncbi:MAG: hypothetical protein ABI172_08330, partial [Ginsengibacter sp.]